MNSGAAVGGLGRVLDDQLRSVAEQVGAGVPAYAAVPDLDCIRTTPTLFRAKHPVNLEALGDGSFVQVCPTLDYKSLWARTDNDDYRGSYRRFLQSAYPDVGAIPTGYDVDHLFNRARARVFRLTYIRMGLVPTAINASHGAGYEKGRLHAGIGTSGRARSVKNVLMMKLMGFRSPPRSGAVTDEMRAFADRYGAMLGESPGTILEELRDLVKLSADRPHV